jgi:multiple RNA-binding domain-containing protein 1
MVRKHFASKGHAFTDLRLVHTSEGRFRRFAYIGFASADDADACRRYFDGTFFDTGRIEVAAALPFGDPSLPRAWSRHSQGSSAFQRLHQPVSASSAASSNPREEEKQRKTAEAAKKRDFLAALVGEVPDAAELGSFLKAMRPQNKTKTWENDDEDLEQRIRGTKASVKIQVQSVKSRKTGGAGILLPKVHMKFDGVESEDEAAPGKDSSELLSDDPEAAASFSTDSENDDLYENFPTQPPLQSASEAEPSESEASMTPLSAPLDDLPGSVRPVHPQLSPDLIAESGRLFVRNLAYTCSEEDLTGLFTSFGPLSEVHIPLTADTKQSKGFAYVLFMFPTDAVKAYAALDGTIFQGRLLHILPAQDPKTRRNTDEDSAAAGSKSYAAKKQKELKEQAGRGHNWNSLFIRPDTVLDAIAAKLGVPKSSIMNAHESDSLATRLAVAETHIVQETKEYLETAGVCLDAFSSTDAVERSKTLILVKNLPFATEESELRSQFAKFGVVDRFLLPPLTRAIALVEFVEASEARAAFRHLAYSNFKGAPLFLEWAPVAALKPRAAASGERPAGTGQGIVLDAVYEKEMRQAALEAPVAVVGGSEADQVTSCTLYVKNLSFATEEPSLRAVFARLGVPIRSVRIPRKADPKRSQALLSLGFGFVEFETGEAVNRAIDELQGAELDGHKLVLRKASTAIQNHSNDAPVSRRRDTQTQTLDVDSLKPTKLLIKNVPFEASVGELRDLLRSFSSGLKRLRLPKKMDGRHRGFGFAEFVSHGEAKHVMETLAATHFYGRHLVIEWASVDKDAGAAM